MEGDQMTLQELQNLLRSGKADKSHYKEYALACHPDLADDPDLARSVFVELQKFMGDGSVHTSQCILKGKQTYIVGDKIAEGSISDIHRCNDDYVLKVALSAKENKFIKNEFDILSKLKTHKIYQRLLPDPVELLKVDNREAAVYKTVSPLTPLTHWKELDERHVAWITKRLLMVLGHAHSCGYVHGNIDGSHILVNHETHGIQLVGWSFSGEIGYTPSKKPAIVGRPNDTTYDCSTDIFMGLTALKPFLKRSRLDSFFTSCLVSQRARPNFAWDLHEELDAFLGKLFGKPKFIPLSL